MFVFEFWCFEIKQIYLGVVFDLVIKVWVMLIYQIILYVFDSVDYVVNFFVFVEFGNIYICIQNFMQDVFEQCFVVFEGGIGVFVLVSGQVVLMFVIFNIVQVGDYFVVLSLIYGGMYNFFKYMFVKFGIEVMFVENQDDVEEWCCVVCLNMKLFFVEIIGNLQINIFDICIVVDIVYENGVLFIVDNMIVMLYLIWLFEFGVDIVVYLVIKFFGGYGIMIGGVIIDGGFFEWLKNVDKFLGFMVLDFLYYGVSYIVVVGDLFVYIIKVCVQLFCDFGLVIVLQSVWNFIQGVEIFLLCIECYVQNVQEIVEWLDSCDDVVMVNYLGLFFLLWYVKVNEYVFKGVGVVLLFEFKGGVEVGWEFVNSLLLFSYFVNIGDVCLFVIYFVLIMYVQFIFEQQFMVGVIFGFVWFLVGIENVEDFKVDLDQVFVVVCVVFEVVCV